MNLPFPCEKNKPLCELSTFGIGGPARYFAQAKSVSEMQKMVRFAHKAAMPYFILGKGSNCLFDDRGFDGLVVSNRIDYLKQHATEITVGAGYSFARLGTQTAKLGLAGLEFASGIPATVGGAVYMNAGASGQETQDTLAHVLYVSEEGELVRLEKKELAFSYRASIFQKKKGAVVEATFHLKTFEKAKENQRALLSYRLKTQPYKDKSAGCAFRNPLNEKAGKLIEECGLKGLRMGGAQISEMHANFIVNTGGAKTQDVLNLIHLVKERIFAEKNILLEEEIRFIPMSGNFECV